MTRFTERPRTVYFIRPIGMNGPVKIGCSASPDGRRTTLATWSPFALEIVAEVAGNMEVERKFHSLFRDQHKGREWFDWSAELQSVIEKVADGSFDLNSLPAARVLPRNTARKDNGWSDRTRRTQSYAMRIKHIGKKHQRFLPESLTSWRSFVDDPEQMKPIEAFIADPRSNGLTLRQRNRETIKRLKHIKSDWARNRIAELRLAA